MDSKYHITEADLVANQALVAMLWAQGLDGLVDGVAAAKYRHYYIDNPAGKGRCLLLHESNSTQAVGVQGLIPRTFAIGNRRIDVASMADFVVAPEHRTLGPALQLLRASASVGREHFAFVYVTPNDKAQAIVKRAGFRPWGALTRYTKIIRSEGYWRIRLPLWMVGPVAAVADAAITCADLGRVWLHGRKTRWSEQTSFDPKFDIIWQRRQSDLVAGERSKATLSWRYASSDIRNPWHISLATDSSNVPVGYVVWREHNGTAMISDIFCPEPDTSFPALLQTFAWYMRRFPVDRISLEFFGRDSVVKALFASGFAERGQRPIVVIEGLSKDPGISARTIYMTSFDRDHDDA